MMFWLICWRISPKVALRFGLFFGTIVKAPSISNGVGWYLPTTILENQPSNLKEPFNDSPKPHKPNQFQIGYRIRLNVILC